MKTSTMKPINTLKLIIESHSANEGFARVAVSSFVSQLDPNVEDLGDLKTAVSEAVTNSIVHGYPNEIGKIYITVQLYQTGLARVRVKDNGCGIEDVKKAMEPLFTTSSDERAGLGFAVMESFTDKLRVISKPDKGTTVTLEKYFNKRQSL